MNLFKKRFHPLGGFYLEGALKWLIPLNPIMLCIGLVMLFHDIYSLWNKWLMEKEQVPLDYFVRLGLWLGYFIHAGVGYPTDFLLYRANKNKNAYRLKIWVVINFFNSFWTTIVYWAHTIYFGLHYPSLAPYTFYCIFRFYMSVIIHYYRIEVEEQHEMEAASRMLTDEEVKEFEEGTKAEIALEMETRSLMEKVQHLKYRRDEFEINLESLEIDKENPLGNGEFGVVYRGVYHAKHGDVIDVAVKTFESGIMDALCFKALLTELKVMTYLGHHENVLGLIGAVTGQIKSRSLLMVLEFCPYGSLLEYLRASRGLYQNFVVNGDIKRENTHPSSSPMAGEERLSTLELIQWATEIASGMSYLEDMKVVHGDLAARNLLLTGERKIKIADFGLARQLYQYSVYVKRQNTPLPWRWLAFESITDMNFSSKSDVWAYGVVLHELFTLGEVPYIETRQFTLEFIEGLRNGMRLEQAPFCPDKIYQFMKLCWNEDAEQRPSFRQLEKYLNSCL